MPGNSKQLIVYSVLEKKGGNVWVKVGKAFVNRDDSLNVYLDALPMQGKLHLREKPAGKETSREEQHEFAAPPPGVGTPALADDGLAEALQ